MLDLADHHVAVTALSHLKARTSSVPYTRAADGRKHSPAAPREPGLRHRQSFFGRKRIGSPGRIRTSDPAVNRGYFRKTLRHAATTCSENLWETLGF